MTFHYVLDIYRCKENQVKIGHPERIPRGYEFFGYIHSSSIYIHTFTKKSTPHILRGMYCFGNLLKLFEESVKCKFLSNNV